MGFGSLLEGGLLIDWYIYMYVYYSFRKGWEKEEEGKGFGDFVNPVSSLL